MPQAATHKVNDWAWNCPELVVREEAGRGKGNREKGLLHFLVAANQKHWAGLLVPWLRRSKALPENKFSTVKVGC
jgi:hypothetical protein